jgi:hypothetical protein
LKGSGSGSEAGESGIKEVRKDKGRGKAKVTEKDETLRSDGGSDLDLDLDLEEDARQDEDVGGSVTGSDKESR